MSFKADAPWSESEKVSLLAEILKDANVPAAVFLRIIMDAGIEPRWMEIPLPAGRSLRASQNAFNALIANPVVPSPVRPPPPFSSPNVSAEASDSPNPKKRALSSKEATTPGGRTLQPRPPAFSSINGQPISPFQSSPSEDPLQPPRKKRGRPSKLEMEARAQAAAARGEVYPPPKPPKTPQASHTTGKPTTIAGATAAAAAAAAAAAGAAQGATAASPGGTLEDDGDPASKGKKRRGRPTKDELQAKRMILEAAALAASSETPGEPARAPATEPAEEAAPPVTAASEASAPEATAKQADPAGSGETAAPLPPPTTEAKET
ncbi:MAG: hypothetical protein M1838_003654 [Thelocarpon superellum]|nr:MAG: hypothetical protein M1838_003654 [Thelocarpon superellum]